MRELLKNALNKRINLLDKEIKILDGFSLKSYGTVKRCYLLSIICIICIAICLVLVSDGGKIIAKWYWLNNPKTSGEDIKIILILLYLFGFFFVTCAIHYITHIKKASSYEKDINEIYDYREKLIEKLNNLDIVALEIDQKISKNIDISKLDDDLLINNKIYELINNYTKRIPLPIETNIAIIYSSLFSFYIMKGILSVVGVDVLREIQFIKNDTIFNLLCWIPFIVAMYYLITKVLIRKRISLLNIYALNIMLPLFVVATEIISFDFVYYFLNQFV